MCNWISHYHSASSMSAIYSFTVHFADVVEITEHSYFAQKPSLIHYAIKLELYDTPTDRLIGSRL